MPTTRIEVRTFQDYKPYTFDNGVHVEDPHYSVCGSELPENPLVNPTAIVIHSMYVPDDASKGRTQSLDPYDCKNLLESEGVSAHYIIPKNEMNDDGERVVYQMVEEERKAWHAGVSRLSAPDAPALGLNHFSIGIELIGTKESGFTVSQYEALVGLIAQIMGRYAITAIVGHRDVSGVDVRPKDPKTDPWNFDWQFFWKLLEGVVGKERFEQIRLKGGSSGY